jgi:hypothetical protein
MEPLLQRKLIRSCYWVFISSFKVTGCQKQMVLEDWNMSKEYLKLFFLPKNRASLCPWDNRGKANSYPPPPVHKNLPHTWTMMCQQCYAGKAEMWSVRAMHTFSCPKISGTMLQCYVLTCGLSVTAFLVPPQSWRPGQGPHPKASTA